MFFANSFTKPKAESRQKPLAKQRHDLCSLLIVRKFDKALGRLSRPCRALLLPRICLFCRPVLILNGFPDSFGQAPVRVLTQKVCPKQKNKPHIFCRSGKRGATPVVIKTGRPDVAAEINRSFAESQKTGHYLSVWSAGPGVLNHAVHIAAHSLPLRADVRVFPMAYEL